MANKIYSFPKDVFEYYHNKIKEWIRAVLPTKTSDLTNDSDFLDQLSLAGIVASTFSPSSTYAVGEYVLYNHSLYRCKTAITSAGEWDASKWDAVKTQNIFTGSIPGLVPSATAADASKALKGDGTWGTVSTVNVSYDSVNEQLHLDFKDHSNEVLIGGRWYKTVTIGTQTWLAENLDYAWSGLTIGGTGTPTTANAWYYDNNETTWGASGRNCGLLYNWYAVNYLETNKSTLIPGWHVPTNDEWTALANACGGTSSAGAYLQSAVNWSSSWAYGMEVPFGLFPAGFYGGSFNDAGSSAYLWTTTESSDTAYEVYFEETDFRMYQEVFSKYLGLSVRLIKDNT